MDIVKAKEKHEESLLELPNVVGVAIGHKVVKGETQPGREVIKVFVTSKVPRSRLKPNEVVPKALEGYSTDVEEIGVISVE